MLKKVLKIIATLFALPLILLGALFLRVIENRSAPPPPPGGNPVEIEATPTNHQPEILVVDSHESDQSIAGMAIDEEILEALEKDYRQEFLRNLSQMYQQRGFSTSEMLRVTRERYTIINGLFASPVGVATVWHTGDTRSGKVSGLYLYAIGIEGDTLHKVICMDFESADAALMNAPKCQAKLVEVFGEP